jgi:hypothetical protein
VAAAYTELTSLQTSLQYYESDALPLIERTESTLDEDLQSKVIAESQVSGILEEFVRIRVNHLDLRYRYNRLRTQLEIFLGRRLAELTPCPAEPTLEEVVTPPAEPPSAPAAKPLPAPPRAARPATTVQ